MAELPDELRTRAQRAWARYVDVVAPFRPDLHRYCRKLTGDLWDAEDLVQETVLRGFATRGARPPSRSSIASSPASRPPTCPASSR